LGNFYTSSQPLDIGHGYLITYSLDGPEVGFEGSFNGVSGGSLTYAGLNCAYDASASTTSLWVCRQGIYLFHLAI
jgi:hypothetical protein